MIKFGVLVGSVEILEVAGECAFQHLDWTHRKMKEDEIWFVSEHNEDRRAMRR